MERVEGSGVCFRCAPCSFRYLGKLLQVDSCLMAQWGSFCSCTAGVQAALAVLATYMGLRLELGAALGVVCSGCSRKCFQ